MFFRWKWMDSESRLHVWRLFGWFSAMMFCGSCIGVVTWAAWMQRMVYNFKGSVDTTAWTERTSLYALSIRWIVVFTVSYPIEFLFLSVAKLMVLDRMSIFSGISKRWHVRWRILMVLVVAGNVTALVGNVFAAVQFQQCVESYRMSSASYFLNNSADGQRYFAVSQSCIQAAYFIASVQIYCETFVLLIIVLAFIAVGVASARLISSTLDGVQRMAAIYARKHQAASPLFAEAAEEGKKLRLKIVFTTGFIFAAFLLRSVYSTMYAVVNHFNDSGKDFSGCSPVLAERFCDASCYNVYTLIHRWMTRTPEFQLTIVLLSSPLALLVALQGMNNAIISQREQYASQLPQLRSGPHSGS
jgi:hypothetical protein